MEHDSTQVCLPSLALSFHSPLLPGLRIPPWPLHSFEGRWGGVLLCLWHSGTCASFLIKGCWSLSAQPHSGSCPDISLSISLPHCLADPNSSGSERLLVWGFDDLDPSLKLKPGDYLPQFLSLINRDNLSFSRILHCMTRLFFRTLLPIAPQMMVSFETWRAGKKMNFSIIKDSPSGPKKENEGLPFPSATW